MANPHPKWKQDRCKWCCEGEIECLVGFPSRRVHAYVKGSPECEAPEADTLIAELEAALRDIKGQLRIMDVRMDGTTNYLCPMPNATKIAKIIDSAMPQKAEVKV